MIAIIDYGVGNLFSLQSSLRMIGEDAAVTADPETIRRAERLILPGVGAFGDAREKRSRKGLDALVCEQAGRGKPLMGICLGMQMLFERSFEFGEHAGLGLLPGDVVGMTPLIGPGLKVPHIGWNALQIKMPAHPLLAGVREGDCVYFVHSFCATRCDASVIATAEYGAPLTAAVARGNVIGCQFHPEKSGAVGLDILRAFCAIGG